MTESLALAPMLPLPLIGLLAAIGVALLAVSLIRGARGTLLRSLALAVVLAALLNPQAVREERQPQRDVAVIAVDRSASQLVGERQAQTDAALKTVGERLARFDDLEVRIVEGKDDVADSTATASNEGTRLFHALTRAAAEIPRQRFAGALLITDGQVHDVPAPASVQGPVHVLLTGKPGEHDRRLVIENAPSYGIVGKEVTIRYRVEDRLSGTAAEFGDNLARVKLRYDDTVEKNVQIPVGRSDEFTFVLGHAGPTVVQLEVDAVAGELSAVNNRALVNINGVRDRLRVLLVSGQPHAGERTWRNLLKSDPSVDLVHFTILRPPEKDDFTPMRELALIAFPIQELFETKLTEFDLIVFDRYVIRDVLPPSYMRNIVNFVKQGGALLFAVGPEFASLRSLYQTPLSLAMPVSPTGKVLEQGFRPTLTDVGRRHPVTARLPQAGRETPDWGRWFRQIDGQAQSGQVLMAGVDGKPLLVLQRMDKGRAAMFMSDHIWLWARGFEGGGPQGELLRRLAHWLMKEPDLEEEGLRAEVRDGRLNIERRSLTAEAPDVTLTTPSGKTRTVKLDAGDAGAARAQVPISEPGLYKISDGTATVLATAGALNPLEFADLRASPDMLRPVVKATGGGLAWIADGVPDLRRTRPGRDSAGRGWIGFTANKSFVVSGIAQLPLLPGILVMALAIAGLMAAWHREGR
ncbi:MAG TPA: hypothetical protein VGA19_02270 [Rhodospirillales bacterium]